MFLLHILSGPSGLAGGICSASINGLGRYETPCVSSSCSQIPGFHSFSRLPCCTRFCWAQAGRELYLLYLRTWLCSPLLPRPGAIQLLSYLLQLFAAESDRGGRVFQVERQGSIWEDEQKVANELGMATYPTEKDNRVYL